MDPKTWEIQRHYLSTPSGRLTLLGSYVQDIEYNLTVYGLIEDRPLGEGESYICKFDFKLLCVRAILSHCVFDPNMQGCLNYWQTKFNQVEEWRARRPEWFPPISSEDLDFALSLFYGRNYESGTKDKPKLDDNEVPSVWDRLTEV